MIKKYNLYLEEDNEFPYSYFITSPEVVSSVAKEIFKLNKIPQETFVVIGADTKGKITSAFEINRGDINSSVVDIKSVFATLILSNAAGFFVAHNHPSGNPEPSQSDHRVTRHLKEAADIFGIQMHDHLIIGKEKDYSFTKGGYIASFR